MTPEQSQKGREIKAEYERILPVLRAWFESQDVPPSRQGVICCMLSGIICGEVASSLPSLLVGLGLLKETMEYHAALAFSKRNTET